MAAPQRSSSTALSQLHVWKTPCQGWGSRTPKESLGKLIYRSNSTSNASEKVQPGPLGVIIKFIKQTEGLRRARTRGHGEPAGAGADSGREFASVEKM